MINNREKEITKVGFVGIGTNILLVVLKILVGLCAHSIAIILDAINNLTDVISSVITIVGIKIASQKPDEDHPFGHGRVEYICAFIISLIIFATGALSFYEVMKNIFTAQKPPHYTSITAIIVILSLIIKFFLGKYCIRMGKILNSDSLKGAGVDALNDSLISLSILVGIVVQYYFKLSIDNYLGIVISLIIIKAGIDILLGIINDIMGPKPNSEVVKAIKKTINSYDEVMGAYDLIIHNYGPNSSLGSVNLELPAEMNCEEVHNLSTRIQREILEKFHILLTVGVYSVNTLDEHKIEVRNNIKDIIQKFDGVINCHGVYVDEKEKYMHFDTMLDFTVHYKEYFREELQKAVLKQYPGYKVDIKFDVNYSD